MAYMIVHVHAKNDLFVLFEWLVDYSRLNKMSLIIEMEDDNEDCQLSLQTEEVNPAHRLIDLMNDLHAPTNPARNAVSMMSLFHEKWVV